MKTKPSVRKRGRLPKARRKIRCVVKQTLNEKHASLDAIIRLLARPSEHKIRFPEKVNEKLRQFLGSITLGDCEGNIATCNIQRVYSWAYTLRTRTGTENRFLLKYPAVIDEANRPGFVILAGTYTVKGSYLTAKVMQSHVFDAAGNEIQSEYRH